MKHTRKYAAALAVAIAGSVICGSLPARAGGIELDKVDIVFSRNHDDAGGYGYPQGGPGTPPPPPLPQGGPRGHMPPPQAGPRGHMPPPQMHFAGDRHNFGPGGPQGYMPPQPPHHPHGPRHMPPPPRW
ncbi:MAG: hypothetical protein IJR85_07615 [Synergistaceae bacterium]|nr:hypothetical protein [Synergistaceae bacterium]